MPSNAFDVSIGKLLNKESSADDLGRFYSHVA